MLLCDHFGKLPCSSSFLTEKFLVNDSSLVCLILMISSANLFWGITAVGHINNKLSAGDEACWKYTEHAVIWDFLAIWFSSSRNYTAWYLTFFHNRLHDGRHKILIKTFTFYRWSWSLLSASPAWRSGTSSQTRLCPRGRVTTGGWWPWGRTAQRRQTPSPTAREGLCGRVTAAWAAPSPMPSPSSSR